MMQNPCSYIVKDDSKRVENIVDCETIMDGVVAQGMTVAFNRHFDNMKYLETLYNKYKNQPSTQFDYPQNEQDMEYVKIFNDNQKDNWINILNLPVTD